MYPQGTKQVIINQLVHRSTSEVSKHEKFIQTENKVIGFASFIYEITI